MIPSLRYLHCAKCGCRCSEV